MYSELCLSSGQQSEKQRKQRIDKYFELARELRKFWNMRVTVMPIVTNALVTVPKEGQKDWKYEGESGPSKLHHC